MYPVFCQVIKQWKRQTSTRTEEDGSNKSYLCLINSEIVFVLTLWVVRTAAIETGNTEALDNVFKVSGHLDCQLSGWGQYQYLQVNAKKSKLRLKNYLLGECA